MKRYESFTKPLMWFMALLLAAFAAGCNNGSQPILGGIGVGSAAVILPTVTSTVPANADTGVQINRRIAATFSEVMDSTTISTSSFKVTGPLVTAVTGVVTYAGQTAVFTPTTALAANSLYTATITTLVTNPAGAAMAANFSWSFTTGATSDTTAPTILSTDAVNGATGLAVNRNATVTFSEPMDPATLASPATSFTVCDAGAGATAVACGAQVAGVVTYLGNTATFNPNNDLSPNNWYTTTVSVAAKDLAGNALVAGLVPNPSSWKTGAAADITPPTVTITNPVALATLVSIDKKINATFSEAMLVTTMTTMNYTVKETLTGNNVAGTVAYDAQNNIATFLPQTSLTPDMDYTATVSNGAQDLAKIALVSGLVPNPWTFRTAPATVTVVPLAINLGRASTFGIAANAAMTSSGVTKVNGDIALAPFANTPSCNDATGTLTNCLVTSPADSLGLTVNGTIYWDQGNSSAQSVIALGVFTDLNTAFNEGKARPTPIASGYLVAQIGGKTIYPGVYPEGSTLDCNGALGHAVLDAQGDANAIFIFQVGSSITSSNSCFIELKNGAQARNIWFLATASATINTGSTWNGNVLAGSNLSVLANSTVNGRLLAGALGAGVFSMTTTATGPASITISVPAN